ncbi:3-hydroxyacyl-CoA dehydrogenase NAD-binding domain-containing protein [Pusillimonas sp. SM2304]|uniref:3-hydroxyacyl-CoA dehydrogenase family protein n=1 Tax=Pusillimonas sp. SM2304 TaxID=3073241 RepID=UPI0028756CCC|nr:3-hydroxyacyl-CoA dehydrogenase NAD-binding domain-containing protein [Pusillimonas sp. SM2304]MDS1141041.1 3-hydroxyacyl-CoA dehydrogenase NAD-binding domain-containing protein [Pusillimonas sp. SM2304]
MTRFVNKVVVVGGGTMGCAVAAIFNVAGWTAYVVETDELVRLGLPGRIDAAAQTLGASGREIPSIICGALVDVDWADVDIVIECVFEDLALKQAVFAEIEALCPAPTPLTSNSSSFPIGQIGKGLATQSRMLGLHFFMPAHLVPAVEVISSQASDEPTAVRVSEIMRAVGKKPIRVKRDIPGFLANRIQHALMREAIALVEEDFASPEDVDAAVRYGFGFRYIAAGPLLQKDLAGIDIHCAAAATMYPYLRTDQEPSAHMRQLVANGHIGVKSASLRGFYQWTPEQVAVEQKRYEAALLKAARILSDEEVGH